MDELQLIETKYKSGELDQIATHLQEFVDRHRTEILAVSKDFKGKDNQIEAIRQVVQHRGSIHLPSEMADQIKEINNEIWYRGERGDYDRARIQEEWALKYASMWRSFRIKEILYVLEQSKIEILKHLNAS